MNKEQVLVYWREVFDATPVDWSDKKSIKQFATVHDRYSKSYTRLSFDDQGWVSEQVSGYLKNIAHLV